MYLVLFHKYAVDNNDSKYFKCYGNNYSNSISVYGNLNTLCLEDISEVLIFSAHKEDNEKHAKIAKCERLIVEEGCITIFYTNIEECNANCDLVRRNLYGWCIKNKKIDKSQIPPVINMIDDDNGYSFIKGEKKEAVSQNFLAQIESLQQGNCWREIINLFPKKDEISSAQVWDNYFCLSKLLFALSMLVTNKNPQDYLTSFFIKIKDRCLELNENGVNVLSVWAYYNYYMYDHTSRYEYYEEAKIVYDKLIGLTTEIFKEKYRLVRLKQKYFEKSKTPNSIWRQSINEILRGFEDLIDMYDGLDDDKKAKYKKYYIRSLFRHIAFSIDNIYDYWECYWNKELFNKDIKDVKFSDLREEDIKRDCVLMEKLNNILNIGNVNIDLINSKPNYFDVRYREAQLEQVKGLYKMLKGFDKSRYVAHFEKSKEIIDDAMNVAHKYRKNPYAKFNFPHYLKLPKAINHYFLQEYELIEDCFIKARFYMIYEKGVISALMGKIELAINELSSIPENDNCYNKAQKLIERLYNENR